MDFRFPPFGLSRLRPRRFSRRATRRPRVPSAPAALVLLAITGGAAGPAVAGDVTAVEVYRRSDRVLVDVVAANLLDERTSMTIDSGLPGTCVYRLRLEGRDRRPVAERWVELSLRLDLWENVYRLEDRDGARSFASLAEADSAWSRIRAQGLCAVDRLRPDAEYRLIVGLAVQPLAAEDRERLSRYVSRNSGGGGEELALDVGKVLSRLFRGRDAEESSGGHVGEYFRLADLEVRP